jgi:hypothetical protein
VRPSRSLVLLSLLLLAPTACEYIAGTKNRKASTASVQDGGLGKDGIVGLDAGRGPGGETGTDGPPVPGDGRRGGEISGTGGATGTGGIGGAGGGVTTGGRVAADAGPDLIGDTPLAGNDLGTKDLGTAGDLATIGGTTSSGGVGGKGGVSATGGTGNGGVGSGGTTGTGGLDGGADAGGQGGRCEESMNSCNGDLSNLGTGDFEIKFTLKTSATQLSEILNQRAVCANSFFWDIQLLNGTLQVEVDDNHQHYTSCQGTTQVNDGKPHRVVVRRVAGRLTTYVDCVLDMACACAADLSTALNPLRTTLAGCQSPPPDLVGTLSDVCVSSGIVDAGAGGTGGADGAIVPDAPIAQDGPPPTCPGAFLFDDFSGTTLDTAKWWTNTSIPQGSASVVQTGGYVELANRGYLNTVRDFVPTAGGVRITGKWTFDPTAADDSIQVLTRTDGTPRTIETYYGEAQAGIQCAAFVAYDTVEVVGWGATVSNATSSGSFPINQGDTLIFEMTDDGSLVTCAFVNLTGGTRGTASATSTFAPTTNRIAFHNREFEGQPRRSFADDLAIESGFVNRPAHHYLFEESSGPTAYDLSGTVDGTLAAGASRVAAIRGQGVSFAGTSDGYVDLGATASALGTSDFTIAFWFKVPDTSHLMDLLGDRVNIDFGNFVQIRMNAGGSIGFELCEDVSGTNYQAVDSAPGYDDSAWHHLAVRRQGTTLAMFVDGALAIANTRTTGTRTNLSNGAPLRLGSSTIAVAFDGQTTGVFDDVRVYGSALTDCDIALIASRP